MPLNLFVMKSIPEIMKMYTGLLTENKNYKFKKKYYELQR